MNPSGTITATAALPSSTSARASDSVATFVTCSSFASPSLLSAATTASPSFAACVPSAAWVVVVAALAAGESRLTTTTSVAGTVKPPAPPNADPKRKVKSSGAPSIMASAVGLRSVRRTSFNAMASAFTRATVPGPGHSRLVGAASCWTETCQSRN